MNPKHVQHNYIHSDYGSSEKCPVCNGTVKMDDDKGMREETDRIMYRKQAMMGAYAYSAENNKYSGKDDINKARIHSFSEVLQFSDKDDALPTRIQVLKAGVYNTQKYGTVTITSDDLKEMVKNFKDGVRAGSALPIDIDHDKGAAAGWIKGLEVDSKGILWGDTEWTKLGQEKLTNKEYGFISAEFDQYYVDPEHSFELNNVISAASLVNRPMLKELEPLIKFSEEGEDTHKNEPENQKLTDEKKDVMMFIDLDKKSTENNMNLSDILKTPKADRTSDQAKYLSEHQEELSEEQKAAEGLTVAPEVKTEDKTQDAPVKAEFSEENGKKVVKVEFAEWESTQKRIQALEAGKEKESITGTVSGYVFNEDGGKITKAQVEPVVEFMEKLTPALRVEFEEKVLKTLPDRKIFGEIGDEELPSSDTATQAVMAEVKKFQETNPGKTFKEGFDSLKISNPALVKQYEQERGFGGKE